MIIVGGKGTLNTVSVYNVVGWQGDLPPLITGRHDHACASYTTVRSKILLVTGGYGGGPLDSTEIFDPVLGSWSARAALPTPMGHVKAASLDNRVLIVGMHTFYYKINFCKKRQLLSSPSPKSQIQSPKVQSPKVKTKRTWADTIITM